MAKNKVYDKVTVAAETARRQARDTLMYCHLLGLSPRATQACVRGEFPLATLALWYKRSCGCGDVAKRIEDFIGDWDGS